MYFNKRTIISLISVCCLGLIFLFSQLYTFKFSNSNLAIFLNLLVTFGLILYLLNSIFTIFLLSKLKSTSMNLEKLAIHNKTLESMHDKTSAFRHDIPNILQGMSGYINRNDMNGLKTYYSQFVEDIHSVTTLGTLSPKVINSPAVYNLLANKYYKAENLDIKVNLEVFLDFNTLNMKTYEFARILGILIDNAIEATSECEEKIINVTIRKDTNRHMQLLLIENTYKNKNISTDKIYEKGYSTKSGNTGLGLWEVRQILKKNKNLNLYTTKNDKFFSQQLEIYVD